MPTNIFIKIETVDGPVEGESLVKGFEKQIELTGWSFGVQQSGSAAHGTGGSTGVSFMQDLAVTAGVDKSFPVLVQAAALGTHLKQTTLTVVKTGGETVPYLTITTTGGILSNVSISGSASSDGSAASQFMSININFSKIEIEYQPQGSEGAAQGATTATVNLAENAGGS